MSYLKQFFETKADLYAGARSQAVVCNAISFQREVDSKIAEYGVRAGPAILVSMVPDEDLRQLPQSTMAGLVNNIVAAVEEFETQRWPESVTSDSNNPRRSAYEFTRDSLAKLYKNFDFSPAFKAWDYQKRVEFADILKNDPVLVDARKRWDVPADEQEHMGLDDKMKVLDHVIDLQAQIYGADNNYSINKVDYLYLNENPRKGIHAQYQEISNGKIPRIAVSKNFLEEADFDENLNAVIHEFGHKIQADLGRAVFQGKIDITDPLYYDAVIFGRNRDMLGEFTLGDDHPNRYEHYRSNPTERHSHSIGEQISRFAGIIDTQNPDNQPLSAEELQQREQEYQTLLEEKFTALAQAEQSQSIQKQKLSGNQCALSTPALNLTH